MGEDKLLKLAFKLAKLMDKAADEVLPGKIVGIVKTHSKLAVGSAFIPVPGADLAAGAASIWGMYIRINKAIDLPFKENIIKSIGSGVATNLAGYIVVSGVGGLLKFVPGLGSLGGGIIMATAMYACTLTSGYIYLKALCALIEKKGINVSGEELKKQVTSILENNKEEIKTFINEAKEGYKK